MRTTFIKTLVKLAEEDESIVLLTADMGFGVFEEFKNKFPNRYYNVGIAEQNMIGMAAGLAIIGKKVYVYSIIPFLTMRAFEQIRIDICYQNLNVKLIGVGGGVAYGPAGATHHAIEDLALMRSLPNMSVVAPGDPIEVEIIMNELKDSNFPIYIRLSKNNEKIVHAKNDKISFSKISQVIQGKNTCILTTGNMLELGEKIYKEHKEKYKQDISVYSVHTIKPLDIETIKTIAKEYNKIITLEEHSIYGGLYSSIMEVLGLDIKKYNNLEIIPVAIKDKFTSIVGDQEYIRNYYGITVKEILKKIKGSKDE